MAAAAVVVGLLTVSECTDGGNHREPPMDSERLARDATGDSRETGTALGPAELLHGELSFRAASDSGRIPVEEVDVIPPLETLSLTELQDLLEKRIYPLYEARFAAGLYETVDV